MSIILSVKKIPEKISRTILSYNNLMLKIHVRLKGDNGGTYHNNFNFMDKNYINLNPTVYLTLEMTKDKETVFDKTKGFLIGQGNIGSVSKLMETVLKDIYTKEIFAIKNNNVIIFEDMSKKYSKQITIPRMGQSILIKPAVIYDENETTYEGVHLFINKTDNIIPLSIEEYENLVYAISHIDLFTYSQTLINYLISYYNDKESNDKMVENKGNTAINKKVINWGDSGKTEKTVSNFRKMNDNDMFNGII